MTGGTYRRMRFFCKKMCTSIADRTLPKKHSVYRTFDEYLRWATIHRAIRAPFDESDKRVLGFFDGQHQRFYSRFSKDKEGPLVSIIMPTYNRCNVIGHAIESVLQQSYRNWELLIVDDGGTDDTEKFVSQYQDSRIEYRHNPHNLGVSAARNQALEKAQGSYIAYLDSDNRMSADFLLILVNLLRTQSEHLAAYCGQRVFEQRSNPVTGKSDKLQCIRFGPFNRSLLENYNYLDINTFLHHRSLYEQWGGFDESMRRLVDWELILRYTQNKAPLPVACLLTDYLFSIQNDQITVTEDYKGDYANNHKRLKTDLMRFDSAKSPLHSGRHFKRISFGSKQEVYFQGNELYHRVGKVRPTGSPRRVSIIIPNFEALEFLQSCLTAIESFTPRSGYDLIIIDNGSGNPVKQYLSQLNTDGRAQLVLNEGNQGFTAAVNQGLQIADPETDVVLMNNDTVVTRGWLEAMQEVCEVIRNVGIVAPRQVLPAMTETTYTHKPEHDYRREVDVTLSDHHQNVINPLLDPLRGFAELSYAPFFCAYITRSCLNTVGLLDQHNGFHYRSDRLFCDAVRLYGKMKIVYTPHSKVYHFLQRSTKELRSKSPSLYRNLFVSESATRSLSLPEPSL